MGDDQVGLTQPRHLLARRLQPDDHDGAAVRHGHRIDVALLDPGVGDRLAEPVALATLVGGFGSLALLLAVLAVLSLGAGIYMVAQPVSALGTLTLFLAGYFVATGVIEVIGAFGARPVPGWGWLLFGSIVSIALGVMIWRQFPLSGAWAIGTLVGVRMLMSGWTWITIGGLGRAAAIAAEQ